MKKGKARDRLEKGRRLTFAVGVWVWQSKSVADAVHMLVDHIFKQASNGGASPVRRRPGGGMEEGHYEAGWADDPAPVPGPMDAHYWRAAR